MDHLYLLAGPITLVLYYMLLKRPKMAKDRLPPIVKISPEDIFSRPREAYGDALKTYGPVIGVHRKGNLEYIVDHRYANYVLTNNHLFSFEEGSAAIMNLQPIMYLTQGTLFRDLQDFVRDGILEHMDEIVYRIFPLFDRDSKVFVELSDRSSKDINHPSCHAHFRNTIAETTLLLLLGPGYVDEKNLCIIEEVAQGMAELTGQYQNFSFVGKYFPSLWVTLTWINVMLIKIPFAFLLGLGPRLWKDVNEYERMVTSGALNAKTEPRNVLYLITKVYTPPDGRGIGVFRRLYIAILLLCLIFAAVHTTTVVSQWVLFQLAAHPEYLEPLRLELSRIGEQNEDGKFHLTFASLREARLLDSFIREVMRLKGDTISTMRYTTCDVPLGDVVIPKGHFVTPMSTTVHENPEVFGEEPTHFNGFQWAEQNKDAVMTGPSHIAFGLGRFACPGRLLAINEIKLIVLTLIGRATPSLLEGYFEVTDPLNTVTQPPKGTLFMTPLAKPLL